MTSRATRPSGREPESDELIAVVTAMEDEIVVLRERVRERVEIKNGPARYTQGLIQGVPVVLCVTGDGKRNADIGLRKLIQKCTPRRVLVLGIAGALSGKLKVGELVVSSEVLEGNDVLARPDLQWLEEEAVTGESYELGRLVTVDEIVATPEGKQHWWGQTERDQPAAVDMESACFARVATAYGLPYLIVRAITDTAGESLPSFLEDCRRQDGSIDQRKVVGKAIWRPRSVAALLRLRTRMNRSATRLANFAEELIAGTRPGSDEV